MVTGSAPTAANAAHNLSDATLPVLNSDTGILVTFCWEPVTGYSGKVTYDVEIAYDSNFDNLVTSLYAEEGAYTEATHWVYDGLEAGQTYYWRVRVAEPMKGRWSEGIAFTTSLIGTAANAIGLNAAGRIYPPNGATGVSTTPVFTWGSVEGATSYEFRLASDATFTQLVDSRTGLIYTAYAPAVNLQAGTIYFWQVRAVNEVTASDWVTSIFTTSE